ncbi:MAG TPA: PIN domain-containing protein [archaeon]|nr:PIN domain-containing protein [archaeon]
MKKTDSKLLFDSSAWIEYFFTGKKELIDYVESGEFSLISSVISIYEVGKKLVFEKYSEKEINDALNFIKENSLLIYVDEELAEDALKIYAKYKLHMADSLIYATALKTDSTVITLDNDFKKLNKTIFLGK